jgi:hypothetical protein
VPPFSSSSKARLTSYDLPRFPRQTLFDRIARAVSGAGCLPRKELYEAWEVARRMRRLFRGGRIVDLGGGHGLVAQIMMLLDETSPGALVVDRAVPRSSAKLHTALAATWPRLEGRVTFVTAGIADVEIGGDDVVVSVHGCGSLTDEVIGRATGSRAKVAVLPCCHDLQTCDPGVLTGWMDGPAAIDAMRAVRLEAQGYRVWTQMIPVTITPKNRLLMGAPVAGSA